MVVFVCNGCGQSIKKAQVDSHFNSCPKCLSVSCLDCSKDFNGDEYKNHIKCITENEKYGGKDYKHKISSGAAKQEEWTKKIQEVVENIKEDNPRVASVLQQFKNFDNIPRKKVKFMNYIKNSIKGVSEALTEEIWDLFSEAINKTEGSAESSNENPDNIQIDESGNGKKNKKKKKKSKKDPGETENIVEQNISPNAGMKRKISKVLGNENAAADLAESPAKKKRKKKKKPNKINGEDLSAKEGSVPPSVGETDGKLNLPEAVLDVLKRTAGTEISVKRLRTRVHQLLFKNPEDKPQLKWASKFNKKIKKMSNVKIENDRVQLISN